MASRLIWKECFGQLLRARSMSVINRQLHSALPLQGTTAVRMPSLSPTMTEGTIVNWVKKEGDPINPGDVLCEIQTDKAVVALECDEEGIFAKILVKENTADVKVGTPIALWVDSGDDWKNVEIPSDLGAPPPSSGPPAAAVTPSPKPSASAPPPPQSGKSSPAGSPCGPAARSNLTRYGLSPTQVPASGPKGILLKHDVLSFVDSNKIQPVDPSTVSHDASAAAVAPKAKPKPGKPAPFRDIELTNMRRTIAKRLVQSKLEIPHAYATVQCSVESLTKLRKKLQAAGLKCSVNDFIIKSTANALAKCPQLNVVWEKDEIKQKGQIDISVAVATDTGLITPIVTDVAARDVFNISENIRFLAGKAKAGKLQPQEFMGGTFTISNLGMFGVHHFTAIINPPQCGILAVGGSTLSLGEDGKPVTNISLSLSYDARAFSEADAAKFLAHLKAEIESPSETSMNIYNVRHHIEYMEMTT